MSVNETAVAALNAAVQKHQKVAASSGVGGGGSSSFTSKGDIKVDISSDTAVLESADRFYKWLQDKSL